MLPESLGAGAARADTAHAKKAATMPVLDFCQPIIVPAGPARKPPNLPLFLLYRKVGVLGENVVLALVCNLYLQRILPRIERRQRQQLLNCHLLSRSTWDTLHIFGIVQNR